MIVYFLFIIIIVVLYKSVHSFLDKTNRIGQRLSPLSIILLVLIYINVLTGFSLFYLVLELEGIQVLVEEGQSIQGTFWEKFEACMYFSAMTLLSVGYGEITPVGIGRWIAVAEALLGYTMPAVFLVRSVIEIEKHS